MKELRRERELATRSVSTHAAGVSSVGSMVTSSPSILSLASAVVVVVVVVIGFSSSSAVISSSSSLMFARLLASFESSASVESARLLLALGTESVVVAVASLGLEDMVE